MLLSSRELCQRAAEANLAGDKDNELAADCQHVSILQKRDRFPPKVAANTMRAGSKQQIFGMCA